MPNIHTGFWVRVVDGQVKDCWDYKPSDDIIATQPGWQEAVEYEPEVNPMRQYTNGHYFNLSVSPVEIRWNIAELTVDDRKGMLIGQADSKYRQIVQEQIAKETDSDPDSHMDMNVVNAANTDYRARVDQVNACTTQEELDAIWNG